ncbi:hypothetical protein [Actinomadura atramentaria]|uniref:hypothetical protein n=1 Tax=Actinomadura atramentaria TaxID=1990 RepID=UPI00037C5420|nr:hypothetical protein [Actinomadura atramentaria]
MALSKLGGGSTPPLELLFEIATRARLLASPLTTGSGTDEDITFEQAVAVTLSSTPVAPVLTDPDLAVVAKVAENDSERAESLLAGIAGLRADLAAQAEQIGDPQLSARLAAAATAAAEFDADAYALPLPEDDDIALVVDAVNEEVARVGDLLAGTSTAVPAEAVHQSILHSLRTTTPAVAVPPRSGDAEPLVRRVPEADAVTRLAARDSAARNDAVRAAGRLYWQDELLRQALEAETPPDPGPTKSYLSGNQPAQDPMAIASLIARIHVDHLAFSLGVSQGIGNACRQRVARSAPVQAAHRQTVAAYEPLPPLYGPYGPWNGWGPRRPYDPDNPTEDGDHIFDPELGKIRELTAREKIIRNWGVGGFFVGWVGGATVGVIGTAPVGGAGGLIGAPVGGALGTAAGMKIGEWVADTFYANAT